MNGLFVIIKVRRAVLYITSYLAGIFLLPLTTHGQKFPEKARIKISGVIYDTKSSERIPYVHIIDVSRNAGTSADDNGNFSFSTSQGDTIKFTAIGYNDLYMVLDDSIQNNSYQVIRLEPKAYLLESMDFYANDPMKGFYLRDIPRDTIRIGGGGAKGGYGSSYWNVSPSGGSGYITAFANLFNDKAQQEKKLHKILEQERILKAAEENEIVQQKTAEEKYNRELVSRITDLKGEALESFIREFKPSRNFIVRATSYEIALQIVESYREYAYYNGLEVDMDEILRRAKFED